MSELKYKRLFEPFKIRGKTFRNKIFSSPQDTYRLTYEGFLNESATAFYEMKAMGGFATVCLGDMMVDSRSGHSHQFMLRGDDMKGRYSFTRTAAAIKRHGAVSGVELNHAGKNSNVMAKNEGFIYGVSDEVKEDGTPVRAMDDDFIEHLIDRYVSSAKFAMLCGYEMIVLHGGHGWLLSQFLSPRENQRRDKWGGSLENRSRFPLAVVDAIRKAIGPAFPIEMRISAIEGVVPGGYDLDEGIAIAKALDGKVDVIHVSAGHHEDIAASLISHPTLFDHDGINVRFAQEIKKHVGSLVATVGALTDPEMLEEIIASGKADIVNLARQTLADPDFPIKARTGNEDIINQCLRCFTCFSGSMVSGIMYCSTNPIIGHEMDSLNDSPPKIKKKVLVAGGGIAGMQAAITAAERGHDVTLCEKGSELGGVLLCERQVPFKDKLDLYIKRQALRISRLDNIDVRLNTEVTRDYAKSADADVIIAALGASLVIPPIKGIDRDNVFSAVDIYFDPSKAKENVVIIGGGLVGVELAIYLAKLGGRKIVVVEQQPYTLATMKTDNISEMISNPLSLTYGENTNHGFAIAEQLKKLPELEIISSATALEVNPDSLVISVDGAAREIKANTVIYAAGVAARDKEAFALHDCAGEFHQIGDCLQPSYIVNATQTAYQVARDIGRI